MTATCAKCRERPVTRYPGAGLCDCCYKHAWRNRDGEAVERDRAASRAWKERNREANRARDRARAAERRATCERCGGPCGIGSGDRSTLLCAECVRVRHEERVQLAAQLYNEGAAIKTIAVRLGYSPTSTPGREISEARRRGLIGYRYSRQTVPA